MITAPFLRPLIVVVLYLCFSWALSAQNHQPWRSLLPGKTPTATTTVASACDPDVTAPEVHCPTGNCLPTARAAYLRSANGEPFGSSDNLVAMNAVFGSGNWDAFYLESPDAATLLSPAYKVIFLEGSGFDGYTLEAFLTPHLPALETWVMAGGALFINSASVSSPSFIQLGFGGVVLQNYNSSDAGIVQLPGHPVFNTPFTPANGHFTGNSFSYATISGPAGTALITNAAGTSVLLSEKIWGSGKVFFGGMIPPYWHSPQPNAQHMRQNILANLNNLCSTSVLVSADAGACTATVATTALDATATDDCNLVSLTHDFAAAPVNTSLAGAVLPNGPTLVRWTATDATGNTSTCEVLVSVREPEVPVLVCPANLLVPAEGGGCGAVVNFTTTATDNCTPALTVTTAPATGTLFANGTTTVQAFASDASGNPGSCSFTVTVVPNPELCNGLDDDCNGLTDDGAPADDTFYADTDGDGYGDPNISLPACFALSGYVNNALDCNDADYYIQPGAYESCNGIDDNCDGNIDEGVAYTWYADADGDGHGNPNATQLACSQPTGYTYNADDCDDNNAYIHPGAQEDCTNFVDENCDGILGSNAFSISETHTDVYCGSIPDGSISITMAPIQNYTQILWSTGSCCTTTQTNLEAGTYKVTVTNECGTSKTKSITIKPSTTPALRVMMSGSQSQLLCAGDGGVTVTATAQDGCPGYTYAWNTGSTAATLSGLSGGTYSVVVTDGCGCTQTGTFTINEPAPLYLYSGTIIALLDGNYWVQVIPSGGTSPYKFRRSILAGGMTPWSSSNGFADVPPGDYTFQVEDKNGCTAQVLIYLEPFSPRPGKQPIMAAENAEQAATAGENLPSIADDQRSALSTGTSPEEQESMVVFPNPTDGEINIEWSGAEGKSATIQIINQVGQVVRTLPVPDNALRIMMNVAELPAGLYFVKMMTAGPQPKAVRLVKL